MICRECLQICSSRARRAGRSMLQCWRSRSTRCCASGRPNLTRLLLLLRCLGIIVLPLPICLRIYAVCCSFVRRKMMLQVRWPRLRILSLSLMMFMVAFKLIILFFKRGSDIYPSHHVVSSLIVFDVNELDQAKMFCALVKYAVWISGYDHFCTCHWAHKPLIVFSCLGYYANQASQGHDYQEEYHGKAVPSIGLQPTVLNNLEATTQLDYHQFDMYHDFPSSIFVGFNGTGQCGEDGISHISSLLPRVCPPPSAFLGPKCALWDCPRPAQGSEWCQDYCSSFHANLAVNEGPPGMTPVLRPGGIDLKDGPLFAALTAKTQGKDVGIPECEGAATTKSPWNAPELFNRSFLEGETIREWLFFDKPRRAFESGNRKQRSLPDYCGRGWHESRKQVMKEFGGLKRSYYMDPQPQNHFEWHLYEYEITNCDVCALYRLELKLVDGKKSPKGRVNNDSLVDLQQQMGRLSAEFPADNKRSVKGRMRTSLKETADTNYPSAIQIPPLNGGVGYYGVSRNSFVETLNGYYGT